MALEFDQASLRRKFHELGSQREAIMQEAQPLQDERDALRQQQDQLREQMKPLEARLREIKAPLYEIDMDRAQIARLLNGRTGKPEDFA